MSVPMVIRVGVGAIGTPGRTTAAPTIRSGRTLPGLIVVIPSNPADAKGLFKTALRAADPVIFLEHKALFASKGPVPVGEHLRAVRRGAVVRAGTDLTIVSGGLLVHRALEAAERLAGEGIAAR